MKHLILLIYLAYSLLLPAQKLSPEQVQIDIDTVISVMSRIHPTFKETPSMQFLLDLKTKKDLSLSTHDLFRLLQPRVAVDGHTTLQFTGPFLPELENPLFPFTVVVFNNRLFIKQNMSSDSLLKKGTEIMTINGKNVNEILTEMLSFMPGELAGNKIRKLNNSAFSNWYRIIYGNYESFEIQYRGPKGAESVNVGSISREQFPTRPVDAFKLVFTDDNIAYLKIPGFKSPKRFMPFIDSSFAEIKSRDCTNLIIDVTEGGGFSDLADTLMSYITDRPYCQYEKKMIRISSETRAYIADLKNMGKESGEYYVISKSPVPPVQRLNKYSGRLFVLTGPLTYSTSTMFAAMVNCFTDALIIGEGTGQPLISNGDISRHPLPNSGINLYSSHSVYYLPCAAKATEGVKPDIEVPMTLDDLLNDNNAYLEYTLKMIRKGD